MSIVVVWVVTLCGTYPQGVTTLKTTIDIFTAATTSNLNKLNYLHGAKSLLRN
jgi:hypothetical protein